MSITSDAFEMFSIYHLNIIFYLSLFGIVIIKYANLLDINKERILRVVFAVVIPLLYIIEIIFSITLGYYTFYEFFPMHLCSLMIILSPIALLSSNKTISTIVFSYGLFGALMAIAFPALSRDQYYDLRIAFFMFKHGLLAIAPLYLVFVKDFIPTFKSTISAIVISLAFCGIVVYPLNIYSSYNYIYLMSGPSGTPLETIENSVGYIYYLIILIAIGIALPLVFYLPFYIKSLIYKLRSK